MIWWYCEKILTSSTRDTITRKNGYFGIKFVDGRVCSAISLEAHLFADGRRAKSGYAVLWTITLQRFGIEIIKKRPVFLKLPILQYWQSGLYSLPEHCSCGHVLSGGDWSVLLKLFMIVQEKWNAKVFEHTIFTNRAHIRLRLGILLYEGQQHHLKSPYFFQMYIVNNLG